MKLRVLYCLVLGVWVSACGGPAPDVEVLPPELAPCVLYPAANASPRLIRVGLTETVAAADAPVPVNEAERMVFRHLFQTLVTLDCRGDVEPGLAREWESMDDGREWRFDLRDNARWSDGMRVTAEDVREAWTVNRRISPDEAPWIWIDPDSIRTMGEDVVLVRLVRPLEDAARLFAHPALAVARRTSAKGWPLGTGPYLISLDRDGVVSMIGNPYFGEGDRSPLDFHVEPGMDPRDLLAQGVDALLTGNRSALAYAAELPGHRVSGESSETVYALVSTYLEPERRGRIEGLREDLARNVAASEATAIKALLWGTCDSDLSPGGYAAVDAFGRDRVVYRQGDADARALAERLVAVALSLNGSDSPGTAPIAVSLGAEDFSLALRTGRDWAYIYSQSDERGICLAKGQLLLDAPWLSAKKNAFSGLVVGLVTTHTRLVTRNTLVSILRDGDGVFRFDHAGWVEPEDAP